MSETVEQNCFTDSHWNVLVSSGIQNQFQAVIRWSILDVKNTLSFFKILTPVIIKIKFFNQILTIGDESRLGHPPYVLTHWLVFTYKFIILIYL